MGNHFRATELHEPYGITQCCIPPYTNVNACHLKGWKAQLTSVVGFILR